MQKRPNFKLGDGVSDTSPKRNVVGNRFGLHIPHSQGWQPDSWLTQVRGSGSVAGNPDKKAWIGICPNISGSTNAYFIWELCSWQGDSPVGGDSPVRGGVFLWGTKSVLFKDLAINRDESPETIEPHSRNKLSWDSLQSPPTVPL